ncbi:MAG: HAD family phosphatase [Planctomycetes bacterium]|nr:HAD family phosphatase [Planctomycetota bacterium]
MVNAPATIGVIFDMDGVLVDSAEAHFQSWQRLGRQQGVQLTQEQFSATFGRQNRDIIPLLFGEVSEPALREMADRKERIYRDLVRANPPIVDGAIDLVVSLHEAGAQLAVGSSGPRANIDLILEAMGVRDQVRVVVSSDDVSRGKPDPQVFSMACDRLGLPSRQCVVIEDAPSGVEAARAAGAHCVAVLMHHSRESLKRAHRVVEKLADLRVADLFSLVLDENVSR